jgi:hypothetical protein
MTVGPRIIDGVPLLVGSVPTLEPDCCCETVFSCLNCSGPTVRNKVLRVTVSGITNTDLCGSCTDNLNQVFILDFDPDLSSTYFPGEPGYMADETGPPLTCLWRYNFPENGSGGGTYCVSDDDIFSITRLLDFNVTYFPTDGPGHDANTTRLGGGFGPDVNLAQFDRTLTGLLPCNFTLTHNITPFSSDPDHVDDLWTDEFGFCDTSAASFFLELIDAP